MLKRKVDDESITETLIKKHKAVDKKWPDELTPEEAKKIEKIREDLRDENKKIQKRYGQEAYEKDRFETHKLLDSFKNKNKFIIPPEPEETHLTVPQAKRLDQLQNELLAKSELFRTDQEKRMYEIEKKTRTNS